eukprot:TRINITY_DN158_c1_g1_i1.p1 TRINITY_DN158_c1_g1~~TRINITY_DN158_c1_g1_i1.p1  ORF type:complete len:367 (+),score=156.48 TRINITY_DN158_c1_g1_i1:124-1101(+)
MAVGLERLEQLLQGTAELSAITARHAAADVAHCDPAAEAGDLQRVLEERERELAKKYAELRTAEEKDARLTESLRELQTKAQTEIPKIEADRDAKLIAIESAWYRERDSLLRAKGAVEHRAKELAWHVNRGSHIKPLPSDQRVPKGLLGKEFQGSSAPHDSDARLLGEEHRLLLEHNRHTAELADQQAEKVLVNRRREAIASQWDAKPAVGKDGKQVKPVEGTKLWYDQEIARLRAQVLQEERRAMDLGDDNYKIKEEKRQMESKRKEVRKELTERLVQEQRSIDEALRIADAPAAASQQRSLASGSAQRSAARSGARVQRQTRK